MTPKKIALFAIGPLGGALLGFITLPLITWFFSQEDIGRISMMQVTLSFSTLFFSLGLDQAYVREFHETDNKPALLKMTLLPGLAILLLTLSVLLLDSEFLSNLLFDIPAWYLSLLVVVALIASFIARFLSLILRMNEQGLAFSMSQILPKILLLVIIGVYIVIGSEKSLSNLLIANTAAIVLVCFVFCWNTRQEWLASIGEKIVVTRLKEMLKFGFPLIFGGLAFWGLTATDKVLLRSLSSYEELGLYSVSVSFAAAATILQSVFSTVWAPTVYKWAGRGEGLEKIHKVTRYVLLCVVILFCLAGLFSWVVTYLLPKNYTDVQWLVISCLGYPLLYTLSETTVVGIGISRRTSLGMLAAIIAFVLNAAGNWWLIPIYGAAGAAVSTSVSFWVFFILRTEFSISVWQPIPRVALYSYTILIVVGAIISTLFGKVLGWSLYGYWLAVLLSCIFMFKNELFEIKSKVKMWSRARDGSIKPLS
ncbi:lipopolysaccharide biosynthesis protein [Amphritea opalescens]|uniref:Lipopolysaccharide biosynthesis protein n=1 Tax=Amphritea opalescens TaxID=2490544 RepID=A0A430KP02_9GAMM|nr:oligosaccharide flippase family protein [Amphritea opalescens]RTE65231.1 lipopolysaccharide biosynthesis protein [Amphritea opalescens]